MTLTELRYIVTLARERHFGRAAEKCHVSQPTLSVALKKVEQRLGITLFERSSTEVRPTPLGEQIAWQAERVLEESARLDEIAGQGKDPLSGTLRLGVIFTIAPYLLPRLIPALHARAPHMPLYLHENFTVRLAEKLRRGELDVIIVADPFSEPGIVASPLYDEPFCVVLPSGHPLAKQKRLLPEAIAAENLLLLGQGNCFRDQVVQACPKLSEPGGVSGAQLLRDFMREFVQLQQEKDTHEAWFRRQVQRGLDSANAGELLSANEVEAEAEAWRAETRRKIAAS